MISTKIKIFLFLTIGLLLSLETSAQMRRRSNSILSKRMLLHEQRLSVNFGLGGASYRGDLCDGWDCMSFRPSLGIGAMLRLSNYLGLKADLNIFRVYSDDTWEVRNHKFRSDNLEFYVAGYYQLNGYTRYAAKRKPWNIYAFAGVGLLAYTPKGYYQGEWYNLRPIETEGVSYSPVTAIIPIGAAVSFNITQQIELIAEVGYRKTFTDRLDDVSAEEFLPSENFDSERDKWLANRSFIGDEYVKGRGNPEADDGYFIGQVKISYTFASHRTRYRLRRSPLRKRY